MITYQAHIYKTPMHAIWKLTNWTLKKRFSIDPQVQYYIPVVKKLIVFIRYNHCVHLSYYIIYFGSITDWTRISIA